MGCCFSRQQATDLTDSIITDESVSLVRSCMLPTIKANS